MDHESSYLSTQYGSGDELVKVCSLCFNANDAIIELSCCREKSLCCKCLERLVEESGDRVISCWSCMAQHKIPDLISFPSYNNENHPPEIVVEKVQDETENLNETGCKIEKTIAKLAEENEKLVESLNQKDMEIYLLSEEICQNSLSETDKIVAEFEADRQTWQEERNYLCKKIEEIPQLTNAFENLKQQLISKDNDILKLREEMTMLKPAPALGIDIGTCHSCAAYFEDDQVQSVLNEREDAVFNTNVKFSNDKFSDEDPLQIGVEQANSCEMISFIKRLLFLNFDTAAKMVDRQSLRFDIFPGNGSEFERNYQTRLRVASRPEESFTLLEMLALVLDKLKSNAQAFFKGRKCQDAVIVVPANFTDAQRQAVIDAAGIVGLNVLRLVNETNAAFYAYRHRVGEVPHIQSLLMVSVGGGVSEITYLQKTESGHLEAQECHAISLGGEDFDALLARHCLSIWRQQMEADDSESCFDFKNRDFLNQLKEQCCKVKEGLSCIKSIDFKFKLPDDTYFYMTVTRTDFENLLAKHYLPHFRQLLHKVVQNRMPPEEIVMTGGSMRIPFLQQELQRVFPSARICKSVNYGEAIAQGAAIQAAALSNRSKPIFPLKAFPNFTSMTFDFFLIDVETDQIIYCWRMAYSFPLPYDGRIYYGLPDRLTGDDCAGEKITATQFAVKVNINKMPFGVAVINDCHLDDFKIHIKLDKNGVITCLEIALATQPNNAVSFQRFGDGITKAEARLIAGTLDNYHEEIESRMRQKEMCNKLDSLIAFSEGISAVNIRSQCSEWIKWFDKNSNSSIQVLGNKHAEILNFLNSLGIEPPKNIV